MEISCCASGTQCCLVSRCGFDRIVLSASELAGSSLEWVRALVETMDSLRLTCLALNDFCPPELKLCGPEYRLERVEQYVARLASKAAKVGVRQIGVGAPLSRRIPQGFPKELAWSQLLECMTRAAQICEPYRIRILMEPICGQMTNLLNTTAETLDFVQAGEGMGLVYDIYHAWMMGEDPTAVLPALDKIEMVHIAHADHGRRPLTRENIQRYIPYLQVLQDAGFQGELAAEHDMTDIESEILKESCQTLRAVAAFR